ncbi:MAG: hypothetical protein QM664_01440 [Flavihumibacter sp.]
MAAHFLQEKKQLSLPGIGTFSLEGGSFKFENRSAKEIDPAFIEFVKTHTGKMSSLAKSDIESYIMLSSQFLNIGKQMFIEGVGTLVKSKEGSLEFTAGAIPIERLEDGLPESRPASAFEDRRYEPRSSGSRKGAIIALAILTIALIAGGVWYLNNESGNTEVAVAPTDTAPPVKPDSVPAAVTSAVPDSLQTVSKPVETVSSAITAGADTGSFKFIILQTQNNVRAEARYNQLKELGKKVFLEQTDSAGYIVYFSLKAASSDTARKRDSLSRFYNARVTIK